MRYWRAWCGTRFKNVCFAGLGCALADCYFGAGVGEPCRAQSIEPDCHENAMIVLDASQSMYQVFDAGHSRIEAARMAARRVVPAAARNRSLGLMTFGPGPGDQCSNISLKVPVQRNAAAPILAQMDKLTTDGGTPLTAAIAAAAEALDYRNREAVIVVVTDGDETCGRDPCELARALHHDAPDLKIHMIGVDGSATSTASCIAEETNSYSVQTKNLDELTAALAQTLNCPQISSVERKHVRKFFD